VKQLMLDRLGAQLSLRRSQCLTNQNELKAETAHGTFSSAVSNIRRRNRDRVREGSVAQSRVGLVSVLSSPQNMCRGWLQRASTYSTSRGEGEVVRCIGRDAQRA